jgi:hypothetical protein
MNASVFKPSGEFVSRFEAASEAELPEKLQGLLASNIRIPLRSYVESFGQSWTIVGFNPIQLRTGSEPQQARAEASARSREYKSRAKDEARKQMMLGLGLCVGGLAFTVASFFISAGFGASRFLVASGAIFYGAIRFIRGYAGLRQR